MIRNQHIEPSRWHVPVLSLILGLFLGLLIGWVLWPVEWTNSWPADLAEPAKANYLAAVADAYVASGGSTDGKALALDRLRTMQENLAEEINVAKRYFINNGPSNIRVSNLEQLATALDVETIVGTFPVEPEVTVPDVIQPVPEIDTTADGSSFSDWIPWLLAILSGLLVILLALYAIFWFVKRNGQNQDREPDPEPDADSILESVWDQPEADSENDYDFYEEDVDEEIWRESDGHHRSQTAKFVPEPEPAGAPANYRPYTQRQISQPQTPRRSSSSAIITAVAVTPGPTIDDSQSARQQTVDQTSYPSRTISEESVEYKVDSRTISEESVEYKVDYNTEDITENFIGDFTEDFTEDFTDDFAEESDDVMLDKSINELSQNIEDVPIYRQDAQGTTSSAISQPMPYSSGVESLPSEVKSELPSARQSQPANARTVDEARLKSLRPAALLGTYTAHYHMGEPDYEDSYDLKAMDGSHIGIVGMGIDGMGGILDQRPEEVIVLDVWLNDTTSENTLTQLLLSKYAQQHGAGDTSRTDRPLLPAQAGLHFQLESENILLDCEVTEVHFAENHGTPNIFQSLTVKMEVYQNDG